jgi:hypothetical protein
VEIKRLSYAFNWDGERFYSRARTLLPRVAVQLRGGGCGFTGAFACKSLFITAKMFVYKGFCIPRFSGRAFTCEDICKDFCILRFSRWRFYL